MLEHRAGHHCGKHEDEKPDDTVLREGENGHLQIGVLAVRHTGHHFEVLGVLFLHDVHRVIDGDDADKPLFLVHNRKGKHVIAGEQLCDLLFVIERMGVDHIGAHDGVHRRLRVGKQEFAHSNHALKLALGAYDIAGVDCLFVDPGLPDDVECLLHRDVTPEIDVFVRHDAPRGVLRVLQIFVDEFAVFVARIGEQALDDVCGHLLDQVHIVVHIHVVENEAKLIIADGFDDALLHIALHVGERLRSKLLR